MTDRIRRRPLGLLARMTRLIGVLFLVLIVPAAIGQETEIDIQMDAFGLGGTARPGSWTPIRISLTDFTASEPRSVSVRWLLPDADGDLAAISRVVTLNPGLPTPVWLYVPLPFDTDQQSTWMVQVRAVDDDGELGAELAARVFGPNQILSPYDRVIGVIGSPDANLSLYGQQAGLRQTLVPPGAHERMLPLRGLRPDSLPDRWMGLDMLSALVWLDGDPRSLSLGPSDAIQEWVHRGGHLIIVLPEVGMPWRGTLLDPILPAVEVTKWEDVPLVDATSAGGLLRHLSRHDVVPPAGGSRPYPVITLNLLQPVGGRWASADAIPLMEIEIPPAPGSGEAARRRAIVAERVVGHGRVTLVGVPIANPQLARRGLDLPHPDVFWNPILGLRQDTPTQAELSVVEQDKRSGPILNRTAEGNLSQYLPQVIQMSAEAGSGLLLALVVFIAYWLVSGPLAFALLRRSGRLRYSWLAFVGATGAFTLVSWTGARALRSEEIKPRHLSVLDHIADGRWQRAATIASVALDGYGQRLIQVGASDPDETPWHDVVYSFESPEGLSQPFPDVRTYTVDASDQSRLFAPARHTAKQIAARWLGPPISGWSMPNYSSDAERPRVENGRLVGVLRHGLPAPLQDVLIVHVTNRRWTNQRRQDTRSFGQPWLDAYAVKLAGDASWAPGQELDLGQIMRYGERDRLWATPGVASDGYLERQIDSIRPGRLGLGDWGRDPVKRLELLAFYGQLPPAPWEGRNVDRDALIEVLHRTLGREWDLSVWLSRPCLIIVGYLPGSPVPTPLGIDGERLDEADPGSLTQLRWIHPLSVENEPTPPINDPVPPPTPLAVEEEAPAAPTRGRRPSTSPTGMN